MRAIVLEKFGGLDSPVYMDVPEPEPKRAGASLAGSTLSRPGSSDSGKSVRRTA